jgi:hypothetical protein
MAENAKTVTVTTTQRTGLTWTTGPISRETTIKSYRITDMGNIVSVVKVNKTGTPYRFIGQFNSLSEALEVIR